MVVNNFSKQYKLLCRFFKHIGLYKEFLDYQRYSYNFTVPFDTYNVLRDVGNTTITHWLKEKKKINVTPNIYVSFSLWLQAYYPELSRVLKNPIYSDTSCKIDCDKKRITLKIEKKRL